MKTKRIYLLVIVTISLLSCGKLTEDVNIDELKDLVAAEVDENGAVLAKISAADGGSIKLDDSSAISGTELDVPAGSLALDTDIYFDEGETLLQDEAISTSLGLDSAVKLVSAGPSIVVSTDTLIDASNPLTLAIPLSSASLALQDKNLVVLYKITKAEKNGALFQGIITDVEIVDNKLKFKTKFFGMFQAVSANTKIEKATEIATADPIIKKTAKRELYAGKWASTCEADYRQDHNNTTTSDPSHTNTAEATETATQDGDDDKDEFTIQRLSLANKKLVYEEFSYEDKDCKKLIRRAQFSANYTAVKKDKVYDIDLVFKDSFLTLYNAKTIEEFNKEKLCEQSNWVIGLPKVVDFSKCNNHDDDNTDSNNNDDDHGPKSGEKIFIQMYLTKDKLYIGNDDDKGKSEDKNDSTDGSSAAKREVIDISKLNQDRGFTRVNKK